MYLSDELSNGDIIRFLNELIVELKKALQKIHINNYRYHLTINMISEKKIINNITSERMIRSPCYNCAQLYIN